MWYLGAGSVMWREEVRGRGFDSRRDMPTIDSSLLFSSSLSATQ